MVSTDGSSTKEGTSNRSNDVVGTLVKDTSSSMSVMMLILPTSLSEQISFGSF